MERQSSTRTHHTAVEESTLMGPGPTTTRLPFDSYSTSPLVRHYLAQHRYGSNLCKSFRTHYTQVDPITPAEAKTRTTYQSFLRDARKRSQAAARLVQRQAEDISRERARAVAARQRELRQIDELKTKILQRPRETKAMSDQIVEGWIAKMEQNNRDSRMKKHLLTVKPH